MRLINIFKKYFSGKRSVDARLNQDDLNQLTVVKLRSMAKDRGLTGYSKLNKSGLVRLLS